MAQELLVNVYWEFKRFSCKTKSQILCENAQFSDGVLVLKKEEFVTGCKQT